MSTTLLLTHLQNPNPNVPLQTLVAALSHHLAVDQPTPTPLAAAAISSPFFLAYPPTNDRLQALVTAFRHAVQLKYQALVKNAEEGWSLSKAIFSKGVEGGMKEWVRDVLRGLQGGRAVIRLASCVGLLLGLNGLPKGIEANKHQVEDEVIIALAEVTDDYTVETGDWEKEFRPHIDETLLSLTLILASQSLPLIPKSKLNALPLSLLARFLTSTIASSFHHGTFLNSIPESTLPGAFHVPPDTPFAQTIQRTATSPTMLAMAGLSKLTAQVLEILIDSRRRDFEEAHNTLDTLLTIARRVEADYKRSKFASTTTNSDGISPEINDLSKSLWLLLKTLLFAHIMISNSVLSSIIYTPPPRSRHTTTTTTTPQTLATCTLHTLFHLSFVAAQFGGVTAPPTPMSTSTSTGNGNRDGGDAGFTELRKVFYLAVDVLASGDRGAAGDEVEVEVEVEVLERMGFSGRCEAFVRGLVVSLGVDRLTPGITTETDKLEGFKQAKTAYTLACVEQLVPRLGGECVRVWVWGLCVPYLTDPTHRETYESAHSVVLAIFASHAARQEEPGYGHLGRLGLPAAGEGEREGDDDDRRHVGPETEHESRQARPREKEGFVISSDWIGGASAEREVLGGLTGFVQRVVPYYAMCLIENSEEGRLSTAQLRLAYAALVRGACASSPLTLTASASAPGLPSASAGAHELGWYCIALLLDTIRGLSSPRGEEAERPARGDSGERLHRLHLTLISTVPSLPLPLMIRALEEIRSIVTARAGSSSESDSGVGKEGRGDEADEKRRRRRRKELVEAVFAEISERLGDREKGVGMRWWYDHRDSFARSIDGAANAEGGKDDGFTEADGASDAVPRL